MNIYKEVVKAEKSRKNFALLTVVKTQGSAPRHEASKMLVFADGSIIGTIGGGSIEKAAIDNAVEAIKNRENNLVEYDLSNNASNDLDALCGGCVEVFIEVFYAKSQLVICGAGHVGQALSKMAGVFDFDIIVIDNRPDWGNDVRFPDASIIINEDVTTAIDNLCDDRSTYIVIATWGHKYDKVALKSALKKKTCYVGMMGSTEKVEEIFLQLKKEGVKDETLGKVYTPIGLDIKAETPEEIALSIMSEIFLIKNQGTGQHLKSINEVLKGGIKDD